MVNQFTKDIGNDFYLTEIRKREYAPISREEEQELFRKYRETRNICFRDEAIKHTLRFVMDVAKHYIGKGLPLEDLIGEGNVGLLTAAEKFEPERGLRFISYAVYWINQAILDALNTKLRTVRVSTSRIARIKKIKTTMSDLEQELGRYVNRDEIAEEMNLPLENIELYLQSGRRELSLDRELVEDGKSNLFDIIEDEQTLGPDIAVEIEDSRNNIQEILGELTEMEENVVKLYFGFEGEPLTLKEIGEKYNLTRERIRQIRNGAYGKLRKGINKMAKQEEEFSTN